MAKIGSQRRSAIASAGPSPAGKTDDYVPFLIRFQAWWEGVEPGSLMRRRQRAKPRRSKRIDVRSRQAIREVSERWTPRRIEIVSRIYGEGFIQIGGQSFMERRLESMGLDEKMSVLDMSAGLGGTSRLMARNFGSWISGFEMERQLADAGMRMSRSENLKDKAPVKPYDPENVEIQDRRYHFILMRERLHTVKNKVRLLKELSEALTPGGKMMLIELVAVDEDAKKHALVKNWSESEYHELSLWSEDDIKDAIYHLGLELDGYYDDSDDYKNAILRDWRRFTRSLQKEELDQEFVDIMMDEAEVNKARTDAINAGILKLVRIELTRRKTHTLLSDW
ncbi:MAG: hypothetical protein CMM48_17625 [Rhodospirillaceae bacterium]|nr:hypothetical protein [Rhodospirillaceae bacterium]HAA91466.1 hypothetical protein [Rhodospirillaceae bacterium]